MPQPSVVWFLGATNARGAACGGGWRTAMSPHHRAECSWPVFGAAAGAEPAEPAGRTRSRRHTRLHGGRPESSVFGEDLAELGLLIGGQVAGDQLRVESGECALDPVGDGVGAEEE